MAEVKSFSAEVKVDGESGTVKAVFSTFDVIDLDGDVTVKGAFQHGAPVRISAFNHASRLGGALPVGKGTIEVSGDEAILNGKFFMGIPSAVETFETVKAMEDLQEWSYSFDILQSDRGQKDGQQVRFLQSMKVHEVSPVLLGAGINTRTLAVKSFADMTDDEVIEEARLAIKALEDRGLEVPNEITQFVKAADEAACELQRRDGTLRLIAAANGIDINGGEQ